MEVFIRDEEINRLNIITNKQQNGNAIKIGSAIDDYIGCKNAEYSALFKSLDQHDLEIRADERKKWQDKFDELEKWAIKFSERDKNDCRYVIDEDDLIQKLDEMKGE